MIIKAPPDIVPVAMHQQRPPQKLELSEGEVTGLGGGGALVTHDAQPDVGLLNHQCYHRYHQYQLSQQSHLEHGYVVTPIPNGSCEICRVTFCNDEGKVICYLSFLHNADLLLTILTS